MNKSSSQSNVITVHVCAELCFAPLYFQTRSRIPIGGETNIRRKTGCAGEAKKQNEVLYLSQENLSLMGF